MAKTRIKIRRPLGKNSGPAKPDSLLKDVERMCVTDRRFYPKAAKSTR